MAAMIPMKAERSLRDSEERYRQPFELESDALVLARDDTREILDTGIHIARRASSLRPGLPIIYMSGCSRDTITRAGRIESGIEFLEKPFTAEHLVTAIREMLDDRAGSS